MTIDGKATNDCHGASQSFVDPTGRLVAYNGGIYTAKTGQTFEIFSPSLPTPGITQTWHLINGVLRWDNPAVLDGSAAFCMDSSAYVWAYFEKPPPMSCSRLLLGTVPGL